MTTSSPNGRVSPRVLLMLGLLATAFVALMETLPVLDPTMGFGSYAGVAFTVLWCAGLLCWALNRTRAHTSQYGLRSLFIGMTLVALFIAADRVFPLHIPVLVTVLLVSLLMAYDLSRAAPSSQGLRRACQCALIAFASVFGVAHSLRVLAHIFM